MATFTLELWELLENRPPEQAADILGLNDYPLFDESYRPALNQKIIEHFWNREIGQETPSMFRQQLRKRMNEKMPLYNQHYEASRIKFDPLKTVDMKNVSESDTTASSTSAATSASTSGAKSRSVGSDHPQELLSNTGDYATTSSDAISDSTASGTSSDNGSSEQHAASSGGVTGFQGNAAAVIFQLRATFVNVDMMVIEELEDLFMLVWDTPDDYVGRKGYPYYVY